MKDILGILSHRDSLPFPDMKHRKDLMHGDMPGDKIAIHEEHMEKASRIFPVMLEKLGEILAQNPSQRAVVSVCGGSGVGKSEIASLLGQALQDHGIGSYVLSGDNYPHRIPSQNDAERLRIFRHAGLRGIVANGLYSKHTGDILRSLQEQDLDASPDAAKEYAFLAVYQREGWKALARYLGSEREQDFDQLSGIIKNFKTGADTLWLKRMGRTPLELWYDAVDVSDTHVLIIEWTHGNSDGFFGVDLPILLNSTPKETLEHRRSRNRDGAVDSPFITMVLELEQRQLQSQAHKAAIIVAKNGTLLSYREYCQLMAQE